VPRTDADVLLARLAAEGLVFRDETGWHTTRRWQGAMMRVTAELVRGDAEHEDLRLPVAMALVDLFGERVDDEDLADLVEAVLPVEALGLSR
jgi:hypothetical protein